MRRCPSSVAGTLAAATLLAACGSGGDATGVAPMPATTASTPDAGPVALTVTGPENGGRVDLRGRRTTLLPVAGYAAPGSGVSLTADCRPVRCERKVIAGADGHWRLRLRVHVAAGQRGLAVSAEPSDAASAAAANAVLVRLTRVGAPARRRSAPKAGATGSSGSPTATPTTTTPAPDDAPVIPPPASTGARPTRVLLVGDSLAQGIAALLPPALPGRAVTVDAKISRPLAAGMQIARTAARGTVLALSLFTNDDPAAVDRLEAAVRESARIAGPRACAVWATIVRPPVGGLSYAAANARLQALARDPSVAGTVRVVPWAREVAAHPAWVDGDGVHATPQGYQARAALYAQAIDSC